MDLDTISQIVGIISGVIAIILGFPRIFPPLSGQLVRLLIAIGIVMFLYGGISFVSATVNIDSSRQSCLQGYDQNYQKIIQLCDQYANSKYREDSKLGLITIGISFIITAATFFIQNLKTATVSQFALEIIWLALGIWLITFNL